MDTRAVAHPQFDALRIETSASSIGVGESVTLAVLGVRPDGTTVDVTSDPATTLATTFEPFVTLDLTGRMTLDETAGSGGLPPILPIAVMAANDDLVAVLDIEIEALDADGDRMDDDWELENGLDPTDPLDALTDADGDTVENLREFRFTLDPNDPDTDSDGADDAAELRRGSDPQNANQQWALDETCKVTVLNSTVRVRPDGSFRFFGFSIAFGFVRARVQCDQDGQVVFGQSDLAGAGVMRITRFRNIRIGDVAPVPTLLSLSAASVALDPTVPTTQLTATADLNDGTKLDVTAAGSGIAYRSSNPAVASIDENGLVTGVGSGLAIISAIYEGVLGTASVSVALAPDTDGDGLPDDYEALHAMDPGGANLARAAGAFAHASSELAGNTAAQVLDGSRSSAWRVEDGGTATDGGSPFIEVLLPADADLVQLRIAGRRPAQLDGNDFLSGIVQVFDAGGAERFASTEFVLASPNRDVTVPLGVTGARRARFTPMADQGVNPGLSELGLISGPRGLGLDPTDPADAARDFDFDGLTNLQEFQRGTNPFVTDTDSDGVDDGAEAALGSVPTLADSDGDGLVDGDERQPASDTDGDGLANILDPDSDGDGLPDGFEIRVGLSPVDQTSAPLGIFDASFDSDGDFLPNIEELLANTDPLEPDTDADGIRDGEEVVPGIDQFVTNPLRHDSDRDGLEDGVEVASGLDPTDPADTGEDPDQDGLDNAREIALGTDRLDPDTDGDGLGDGIEVDQIGSSPLLIDSDGDGLLDPFEFDNGFDPTLAGEESEDPDSDGLDNRSEQTIGTLPLVADTDGDGLLDGEEVDAVGTSPLVVDSDGDTLGDGEELTVFGTSAIRFDTDFDGLGDGEEIALGTDPNALDSDGDGLQDGFETSVLGTSPLSTDSDGDGLSDRFEFGNGFDPTTPGDDTRDPDGDGLDNLSEQAAGTNPTLADSDGDGLDDGAEIAVHGTNPVAFDTDWGGLSDGQEVNDTGTNPLDAADDVIDVPLPRTLIDGQGFRWSVTFRGFVSDGTGDFDGLGFSRIDSLDFPFEPTAQQLGDPGRLRFGPFPLGGLTVSREVFVPRTDDGFIRYLEIFENPTAAPVTASVELFSNTGTGKSLIATSNGNLRFTPADDWIVSGPAVGVKLAHVLSGPGAELQPSAAQSFFAFGSQISYSWDLVIPPGERRILMHFIAQRGSAADATTAASDLRLVQGRALDGLSPDVQADVVNFVAFADADADGLADFAEAAAGTEPLVADTDGDGLLDGFEVRGGLDPLDPSDAAEDADGDGVDNLAEQAAHLDPQNPDSDGDGATDGVEVAEGTDRREPDTDLDGLSDGDELNVHGTDPLERDSDADGIDDGTEVNHLGTEPLNPDTDGDGLGDGIEVANPNVLDPLDPTDAAADPDGDGLTNAEEILAGTEMNLADTDRDALDDGEEIAAGTSPTMADTDGGGRTDGAEFLLDGTDPLLASDDAVSVALGVGLADGSGVLWTVSSRGELFDEVSGNDTFLPALAMSVDGEPFAVVPSARLEDGGREVLVGPFRTGDLVVSRKVFVPADASFVRVLDLFENRGSAARDAIVELRTDLDSEAVALVATSDGDDALESRDHWALFDDADGGGVGAGALAFSGPFAALEPDAVQAPAQGGPVTFRFDLRVEPGERVGLLHFAAVATDGHILREVADDLTTLRGRALSGLDLEEQVAVLNFLALPDDDADGLPDDDEPAAGTDPANPDSDGDGLLDGFEVRNGFDPTTAGDETGDPDADGLDNLEEQSLETAPLVADTDADALDDGREVHLEGTDPLVADTDGGGRTDGEEVLTDGTDPLDSTDDLVPFPLILIDGKGFAWNLSATGALEAGTESVFAVGGELRLEGAPIAPFAEAALTRGDREVVLGPASLASGVHLTRKVFVPDTDAFARYLEIFENPTAVQQTVGISFRTVLEGGVANTLAATSDGDPVVEPEDSWWVVENGTDSLGVAERFSGSFTSLEPTSASYEVATGTLRVDFQLTLDPGQRGILLHVFAQRSDPFAARDFVEELDLGRDAETLAVEPDEVEDVLNFSLGFDIPAADTPQ